MRRTACPSGTAIVAGGSSVWVPPDLYLGVAVRLRRGFGRVHAVDTDGREWQDVAVLAPGTYELVEGVRGLVSYPAARLLAGVPGALQGASPVPDVAVSGPAVVAHPPARVPPAQAQFPVLGTRKTLPISDQERLSNAGVGAVPSWMTSRFSPYGSSSEVGRSDA